MESTMNNQWLKQVRQIAHGTTEDLLYSWVLGLVISGQASVEVYAEFLRQTYHYVRFSKPIMAECALRLREIGGRDDLIQLFECKAEEENGHEQWALDDYEALGYSRDFAVNTAPSVAVCEYLSWNMRIAESNTPCGFLGTAYVLEYISQACAGQAAKNLIEAKRIPNIDNAVSFLQSHGEADEDHIRILDELLATVEGSANRNAIVWSAAETRRVYPRFFDAPHQTDEDLRGGLVPKARRPRSE